MPLFEHITPVTPCTAPLCAESTAVASSAHATPLGHSPGSVEGVRGGGRERGGSGVGKKLEEVCLVTGGQNGGVVGEDQLLYQVDGRHLIACACISHATVSEG